LPRRSRIMHACMRMPCNWYAGGLVTSMHACNVRTLPAGPTCMQRAHLASRPHKLHAKRA
jgi:hypothetical protein